MSKPKIIAIVGPTASGKTALSIELAKRWSGEVISADSRQVYRGLDIGSGKVTQTEMDGIPHHLLDIADPKDQTYTAADFVHDAKAAIADIISRGKVPIIAGGTFFYLDLLRGKMQTAAVERDLALEAELEKLTTKELIERLNQEDPKRAAAIDTGNRRRLIRALEITHSLGEVPKMQSVPSEYEWLILGIKIEKELLNTRIEKRLQDRLQNGMLEEVERLLAEGVSAQRLDDFGLEYRYLSKYLLKEISYEEMVTEIFAKSRQFAKRQRTWLKRDQEIIWKTFPLELDEIGKETKAFLDS
jgi:tRNA dimethylallyltransferase